MTRTKLFDRVTPRRRLPDLLAPVTLTKQQRAGIHMTASLLLDYPDAQWFARLPVLRHHLNTFPAEIAGLFDEFMRSATEVGEMQWQRDYVTTFDLKRKCSLYLSYYATGDTRKRGTALVTFISAYRAAGWEFEADELPDFLPVVLEFSARSESEVAEALLTAHQEGIEVLRAALEEMSSPWARVVRAVTLSLPLVDQVTQERILALVNEGPPVETVGLSFLGNLPPFAGREQP